MTRNGKLARLIVSLGRDSRGSTVVEFALIGPAMLLLLLAVVQIGLHIQNYNSVRSLASDGARFAVVQYQKGTRSPGTAIETWVRSRAISGVYNLNTDRLGVTVTPAAISRIAGMNEMTIAVTYQAPNYLWSISGNALNINYTRPVFLPV